MFTLEHSHIGIGSQSPVRRDGITISLDGYSVVHGPEPADIRRANQCGSVQGVICSLVQPL